MAEEVVMQNIPDCDFHKRKEESESVPASVDGKTIYGAWAYMCPECWTAYGIGKLGTGYGQQLIDGKLKKPKK
jgi:hypothetical protein